MTPDLNKEPVVVIGSGGFAREVKWLIQEIGHAGGPEEFAGYVVSDLARLHERHADEQRRRRHGIQTPG